MTCSEIPLPAVATLSICHALDNNVLSPQACSNTCWRDQLLANSCNNRSPRFKLVLSISWNYFLYSQCAFHQSLRLHIISTYLSLGPSHFTHWIRYFFLFLCSFVFLPGLFVTVASWNLCMRSIQILCRHKGQCQGLHVTQLCEMWVCMLCLQVCISVSNPEDSQGCWLLMVQ